MYTLFTGSQPIEDTRVEAKYVVSAEVGDQVGIGRIHLVEHERIVAEAAGERVDPRPAVQRAGHPHADG